MNLFRFVVVATALAIASPALAQWQTPDHSVAVGHGGGVTGFKSAAPGPIGVPLTSTGASSDPSFSPVRNAGITPGPANTAKGSLDGTTTSDMALVACTAAYQITQWVTGVGWQCGINPTLPSRAIAATLNLSAFSVVITQGYGQPGDGGGAYFKKLSVGAPFQDTYMTAATRVGGSGYTNNTYLGQPLGGGTGGGCSGGMTVAGGVVTVVSLVVPCPGYSIGDVLTDPFLPGGTGFTYTVTGISLPVASFIDAAGNHWQFITDQSGRANALQFGCKGDWNGTDGAATNNSACIWSAAAWGSFPVGASAANVQGNEILFPRGAYMTCGVANFGGGSVPYYFTIPQGVRFTGVGVGGTSLVECAADSSGNHYIALCDGNAKFGQFGCRIEEMTLNLLNISGSTSGIAAIYSNSGQQFVLARNMEIQAGLRGGVKYEIGRGGAANDIWEGIDCVQTSATANNPCFSLNSSGTQHIIRNSTIVASVGSSIGILNSAGRLIVDGLDIEGYTTGLQQNVTAATNNSVYRNVQESSNLCSQAITLVNGNVPGNILFENIVTGCPITINNGQPGGSNFTTNIVKQITCVAGACS